MARSVCLLLSHSFVDNDTRFVLAGDTYCWAATSGAANATDCTVIADALLYEVQNTGALFNVSAFGVCSLCLVRGGRCSTHGCLCID